MINIKHFTEISKYSNPDSFKDEIAPYKRIAPKNNKPIKEYYNEAKGYMQCNLSTLYVSQMEGEMGENHQWKSGSDMYYFGRYNIIDWFAFVKSIAENGLDNPIFIIVEPNSKPVISEGNHRLEAYKQLGLETIPCEIKFFDNAENNYINPSRYKDEIKEKIKRLR